MIRLGVPRSFRLALRRRDRWEREVEDEITLHLSLRAEQLAGQGAAPADAYAEAVRRFGPLDESRARLVDAAAHREHRMQRTEWLADLRQDVSFAVRTLSRQKGWTAITVGTLALGIGATTAVFSVVSSLLIHAVPYPGADRVVVVTQQASKGNNTGFSVSITPPPKLVNAWRSQSHSFDDFEPYGFSNSLLQTGGEPAPIMATHILPSFVSFAGRQPLRGRLFTPKETADHAHVVLLSEGLWQSRYGGAPDVIGRTVTIDDSTYSIIGVLPAELRVPSRGRVTSDVWLPLDTTNQSVAPGAVARLRPGVDIASAQRDLDSITVRTNIYAEKVLPFVAQLSRPAELVSFRDSLLMLAGAVALVLLVACANVAHLMLTRVATRSREFAVRAALGAGRGRIFRQLAVESLVLSFAGAAGGLFVGWLGLRAMVALRPAGMAELDAARLDRTTLVLTLAVAVVTGITFGVVGALRSARHSTHDALKSGALSTSHSRRGDRVRSWLVVTEMALSATLIVGATLLVRSVRNLQTTDVGFDADSLYTMKLDLPSKRYPTEADRAAFVASFRARLASQVGVQNVALTNLAPGSQNFRIGQFEIDGEPTASADQGTSLVDVDAVGQTYFSTMDIPFVEGGIFSDTSVAAHQVIVNAAFARKHWAPGAAVGHRVRVAYKGQGDWQTIVGVARDASVNGPDIVSSAPILYSPIGDISGSESLMIRASQNADLGAAVRAFIRSRDPSMTPPAVRSMESFMSASIAGPRFTMLLLSAFTVLALLLAAVGLYGVMAYTVIQRTREIGIRVALGAQRSAVARIIVLRGLALALSGATLGLGGAYWATRLLTKLLYGVAPLDVVSFAIGGAVLVGSAVVACLVPTGRALRVDPILAIRAE